MKYLLPFVILAAAVGIFFLMRYFGEPARIRRRKQQVRKLIPTTVNDKMSDHRALLYLLGFHPVDGPTSEQKLVVDVCDITWSAYDDKGYNWLRYTENEHAVKWQAELLEEFGFRVIRGRTIVRDLSFLLEK